MFAIALTWMFNGPLLLARASRIGLLLGLAIRTKVPSGRVRTDGDLSARAGLVSLVREERVDAGLGRPTIGAEHPPRREDRSVGCRRRPEASET